MVSARRELALQIEVDVARYHMIALRINLMNTLAVTIFFFGQGSNTSTQVPTRVIFGSAEICCHWVNIVREFLCELDLCADVKLFLHAPHNSEHSFFFFIEFAKLSCRYRLYSFLSPSV